MTTVLRVRRKRTTDPLEIIILPLKRIKTDSAAGSAGSQASAKAGAASSETEKTQFTFAGTVEKKTQPISVHIQSALRRAKIGLSPKKPVKTSTPTSKVKKEAKRTGAREKARTNRHSASQSRRFKLVQSHRGIQLEELDQDAQKYKSSVWGKKVANGSSASRGSALQADADRKFNFFDIVQSDEKRSVTTAKISPARTSKDNPDDITCNSSKMIREKLTLEDPSLPDSDYVYDLYYADSADLDWTTTGSSVGMRTVGNELVYEYFNDSPDYVYEDEDDENDESNWRNDYPDEEGEGRHPDMFDEYQDDYRYGDASSSDEDIVGQYSDYRHRKVKYVDPLENSSGSDLDEY